MREELPMTGGRGMGRGLAAILSVTGEVGEDDVHLRDVPVELVVPNPRQPRRRFDESTLAGRGGPPLRGAAAGGAGGLAPRGRVAAAGARAPVPGGTYELVAGERRWRAAKL